ncbi:ABC tran domain containing protein, partial [Asbolus verrucosus]
NFTKIEEGIGDKAGIFMIYETVFVTGIIMALAKAWKMAFVCLVPFPISSGIAVFISWLSSKFSKQELEAFEAAGIIAEEVLGAIRTVIAFGGEEKEFKRYVDHLSKAEKNNIKRNMLSGVSNGIMWFFIFASYALSFWYGVGLIIDDRSLPPEKRKYTPSNVVSVFFLILIATWNFGLAAPYFEIFGTACGAATKVFEILDTKPEISVFKNYGIIPKDIQGHIHFEDVYFHYPSRSNVMILQGFNLKIKNGETVALVGSSGSGKTTCIQLIQRFYDPISGSVTIDGIDVREFNLTWLRSNIGVVEQQPVLFATSIAENIRCGNLSASQEDIENAARVAHAHNFIRKLPRSYNTVIGEKGAQLSGGQKQKIAIARALIRKPKILLLDEATSALDASSEAEVQETLNAIRGECVTIIIAHRLSTVRNADRIVVIYEGKVIEKGSHKKLMKKKGAYYNLVLSHGIEDSDESSEASVISISLQWNLALVLISFLPIILLAVFFEQKFSSSQTDANQAFLENSANVAVEAIANYQTVASLGCERMFYDRYVAKIRPYLTNMRKQVHIRSIVMGVARSIMLFAYAKGLDATERIMHLLERVPEIRNVAEPLTFKELLERFYDPLSGNVSLDSKDIKELDIANLRSHMGIVSQEPNLFGTTIAENIAYGANHRTVGMEEIIQAAKAANIHNFITLLPQGYETNLGNKGTQLSDGQKQRVAIARALIRNPQILLLDEATSSLDAKSEKTVQKALDDAQKNRTCIVVAHRIATIQDADLICTLQNGRIVEMGEHKELLERKGLYYKYHKLQTPKLM